MCKFAALLCNKNLQEFDEKKCSVLVVYIENVCFNQPILFLFIRIFTKLYCLVLVFSYIDSKDFFVTFIIFLNLLPD